LSKQLHNDSLTSQLLHVFEPIRDNGPPIRSSTVGILGAAEHASPLSSTLKRWNFDALPACLDGALTVLDLTRVRSGSTAVQRLADWGANVVKILDRRRRRSTICPME
jgi:hypothetical protein